VTTEESYESGETPAIVENSTNPNNSFAQDFETPKSESLSGLSDSTDESIITDDDTTKSNSTTSDEDNDLNKEITDMLSDDGSDEVSQESDDSDIKKLLKSYMECARSAKLNAYLVNGKIAASDETTEQYNKIKISLQNLYDENPSEMILSLRLRTGEDFYIEIEYYFTFDENEDPAFMGSSLGGIPDAYYSYDGFCYIVNYGAIDDSLNYVCVNKLALPMEDRVSPDFADYQNSNALDFINNTHMYFLRYDNEDWDSENQTWKSPEETAAMFYYEDSGLYEAYSISKQILDLGSFEITDYINGDGNHIYSYLPGENYLVSRREYEQIKSKIFEMLTEVTDEPEISSGWINIDDVDKWLDSLA
jgi:hypothetical protein